MGGKSAFSVILNKGEENQKCSPTKGNKFRSCCLSGAQKRGEMLHHPCILRKPLDMGTETKVAPKRAEMLRHPYVFGSPKRGSNLASTGRLEKIP